MVEERRLHSLGTASQETGIGTRALGHFLVEAGALPGDDDRPLRRRVFDARAHAVLLSEIPTLVGPIAMREAIGATKAELEAFEMEGLLVPRTRVAKVKNPWRISDGVDFVAGLCETAITVPDNDPDWETLLPARKRTKVSLRDQVDAIHDKRLTVGTWSGVQGLHGIVVRKAEIDLLRTAQSQFFDNAAETGRTGMMSAAEFGRSVGLRDHGNFTALIRAGHSPATWHTNPKTGRQQYRLSAEDIAAFHERFVTLTTLSNETGHHRNTLKSLLEASQVSRFAPGNQDFGPVFLRAEAIKALR